MKQSEAIGAVIQTPEKRWKMFIYLDRKHGGGAI